VRRGDQLIAFLIQYGAPLRFGFVLAESLGAPFSSVPILLARGALIGAGT